MIIDQLKKLRHHQDLAKKEGKLGDVSWFSGYMAALIDEAAPAEIVSDPRASEKDYPLLRNAPQHNSADFIQYLRDNNVVRWEDDSFLVIENCKYHQPEKRVWYTAFAKTVETDKLNFRGLLEAFDCYEWKKKSHSDQTVMRFHVHIYEK